ncbi:TUBB8 isoform 7 [Pongo abelii]|uniref:TUBB8 isoform 7 n=1 Tax=Pongo abelii TaxID=9601 RepID=A0A2J8R4B0_PONAB|nr:TUBB8 isoform 7 [Pongo abelii]
MREIVLTQTGQCGNQLGAKVAGTCPALCSWIWSPAPWTLCTQGPSGRSSGQTTSSSVRVGLETTGPRDTTQKARS